MSSGKSSAVLLLILGRRHSHLLCKRTVKGPQRTKAHGLGYLRHRVVTSPQASAGLGYAKRVYVIVEAHLQLIRKQMRNIIFAYMKLVFKYGQRQIL